MTSPNEMNDSHYWFGRIDGKIDQLGDKMGHLGETVGRLDERLGDVEDRADKLEQLRVSDQEKAEQARITELQMKKNDKSTLKAAISGGVTSALIGGGFVVLQILTHR